jgi:hypothetical protein
MRWKLLEAEMSEAVGIGRESGCRGDSGAGLDFCLTSRSPGVSK